MLLSLLTALSLAAQAPEPPPGPPAPSAPDPFEVKRLRQARDLRTTGLVLSVAGPLVAGAGLTLVIAGAGLPRNDLAYSGLALGGLGLLGTALGPPLLLAGGSMARGVARRTSGRHVPAFAGVLSGVMLGSAVVTGVVGLQVDRGDFLLLLPGVFYVGGVAAGAWWAADAIHSAESAGTLSLHPAWLRHDQGGVPGLVVTGRF